MTVRSEGCLKLAVPDWVIADPIHDMFVFWELSQSKYLETGITVAVRSRSEAPSTFAASECFLRDRLLCKQQNSWADLICLAVVLPRYTKQTKVQCPELSSHLRIQKDQSSSCSMRQFWHSAVLKAFDL